MTKPCKTIKSLYFIFENLICISSPRINLNISRFPLIKFCVYPYKNIDMFSFLFQIAYFIYIHL